MTADNQEMDNDELLFFADDEELVGSDSPELEKWRILIVDDDHEIHAVTQLALNGLTIFDRDIAFLHAYSADEAKELLQHEQDIAIVLLDVVMENDDAGLQLARYIRDDLKQDEVRIILRTGQPGYAPEEQVIKDYDINDYKTKTELTRNRLVTSIITAVRSYHQIRMLNQSRRGLEMIIKSSANLMEHHAMKGFAEGVLTQLASVLGVEPEGVLCARRGQFSSEEETPDNSIYVLGAAGDFAPFVNQPLQDLPSQHIANLVESCLNEKAHQYEQDDTALFIASSDYEAAIYIDSARPLAQIDRNLLEVFLGNIGVGYENVSLFQRLQHAAYTDELTQLPNRAGFIQCLDGFITTAGKDQVVALVDLNQFSDINDGLGQEAGNQLLKAVAERLSQTLGESCTVARVSSDVFGIIGSEQIVTPDRLLSVFNHPFHAGEHMLPIKAAMGFCCQPQASGRGLDLLKQVYIALNLAKKNLSEKYAYYEQSLETSTSDRLNMIRSLRHDFSERRLQVWYQPQLSLANLKVSGMEALLRWPDGEGGYISPAVFIPLAEYSGLIVDIGAWVLEESLRQLKELQEQGFEELTVGVNVSMQQFRSVGFLDSVINTLAQLEMAPACLELEITESVVMDDPAVVIDTLGKLRAAGVKVSIDDFGTGFSSLSYLQQLPLDRIKIDRAFVTAVDDDQGAIIAETIVALGKKLKLTTVCEGVETEAQATHMRQIGCDEAQGFLYARPMPFADLVNFLSKP
ncbi:bifunctional diguanylate cyclase/phosphodiesterase [Corallincola spongiicola]|uniref:EAL domain-containing protein n=1 Tax=Corallincola spongiicola TaxID=2520508 RepID=A0ABY1WQ17_9GAMM|nr:EAL domain-containing protein [Corallincola spongiicola]TAA46814.1 EAL domain-containing protein [Corallincola spongiicola]